MLSWGAMANPARPLYTERDAERNSDVRVHGNVDVSDNTMSAAFRRDVVNLIHSPLFRRIESKTQLFPESESDLFRDRLTHSLEVAQVAREITRMLNADPFFAKFIVQDGDMQINEDIVEFAALAHDVGHPPFGHTGEQALDICMKNYGGFEGNAQTLRNVCRLTKLYYTASSTPTDGPAGARGLTTANGVDRRIGLNLTYRSVASILKYDRVIPTHRKLDDPLRKGYYKSEAELVSRAKAAVLGGYQLRATEDFTTIECSVMDLADDIAYSTYDIEDALTAGILRIEDFLYPSRQIVTRLHCSLGQKGLTDIRIEECLQEFAKESSRFVLKKGDSSQEELAHYASELLFADGHVRAQFIQWWVRRLISSVKLSPHEECPPLSRVSLDKEVLEKVDVLKAFVYHVVTLSAPLQTNEFRGKRIVQGLFDAILTNEERLLPPYERSLIEAIDRQESEGMLLRQRIICDYVAGMTDGFAASLYDQLTSGEIARMVNHQLYY